MRKKAPPQRPRGKAPTARAAARKAAKPQPTPVRQPLAPADPLAEKQLRELRTAWHAEHAAQIGAAFVVRAAKAAGVRGLPPFPQRRRKPA